MATRHELRHRDLALASAGATLYGAVAAIPSLLVAVALAGVLFGQDEVRSYGEQLAHSLPNALGAVEWVRSLFRAGLSLSGLGIVFAVFMSTAYARGLSRALRRFAPVRDQQTSLPPSWLSRVMALPVLGMAPLLLIALLVAAPWLSHLSADDSPGSVIGASYLSLNLIWVITWLPLTWAFRVVAPGRPSWRAAAIGGVVTGAFISGFLQGFVLFLALPVDLGRPFGGLEPVGVTSALLLWLWVLHVVVCIGYTLTWAVEAEFTDRDFKRTADSADSPARPHGTDSPDRPDGPENADDVPESVPQQTFSRASGGGSTAVRQPGATPGSA